MKRMLVWVAFCAFNCHAARGQAPTTVQLPTFQQFSVGTTVMVPDGGSAFLGGVNSHQSGSTSRGVPILGKLPGIGRAFNNRAFGVNESSRQTRVKATIIDLQEMDAAIRNTAAARRVRQRMGGYYAGDNLLNGKGGIHSGGVYGGVGASGDDEVMRRALFLTLNMGGGSVASTTKKAATQVSKKKVGSKAKVAEPPLYLNGRKTSPKR